MNKNEGGDAFPTIGEGNSQGVNYVEYSTGMSLRDYFAGQAMIGIFSNAKMMDTIDNNVNSFKEGSEKMSEACVAYADSLIKELTK